MNSDEADRLAAIHNACFTTPRPWRADEISVLCAQAGTFVCAEHLGFLMGRSVAGEAELLTIAVDPAARRAGIARRLLGEFETEARKRGADRAFLEVGADNSAALALYKVDGWAETGRRKGYYSRADGSAVDAVILTKPLG